MGNEMKSKDFSYELPEELIAQTPLKDRSSSRMMKVDRLKGEWVHGQFTDILDELREGDLLVFNNTKVIPARLIGKRQNGGEAELLLLKDLGEDRWECLARPGKRLKVGAEVFFPEGLKGIVEDITSFGGRVVRFEYSGIWMEILERIGEMPLPPYIHEKLEEKDRYQTVYAEHKGSAAAPTAGLHFTDELLDAIRAKGVKTTFVTLHVGLGTFRPVQVDSIEDHEMHSEYYHFSADCGRQVQETLAAGGRVIAVGTTSVRVLETVAATGTFAEQSGWTDIFIYPGYTFHWIDGLITNFHLPQSTLLMLVSALCGRENMLAAYEEAVREKYRFFSFGDSMMIL